MKDICPTCGGTMPSKRIYKKSEIEKMSLFEIKARLEDIELAEKEGRILYDQ